MIEVPEVLARTTVAREGAPGERWIRELPGIVAELLGRWGCVVDGELMFGGVGVVVPVVRGSQGPAVLKVSFPHPGNVHEPDAFAAWAGQGAVLLYERDDARFAMLLERVGSSTLGESETDEDVIASVAGQLSRRLAVPAPTHLPRLSARADEWAEQLQVDARELAHSIPARVLDSAHATVRDLGRDQPDTLVHGDLHARNVLPAEREPWLAVDPKGYAGDQGYDGANFLKTRAFSLLVAPDLRAAALRLLDVFGEAAGVDRERLRRLAQLHAVQAAFWARRHGFRVARGGPELERLTAFAEELAEVLTDGKAFAAAPGLPDHPRP
ncbi:kinase [Streptomyces sp. V2]|uniref:Aminoglycoside phosphotransferase family protein n=1 Tax=Streptomyces niveiscabiei TaxID=164115 RepID=A0ABW9I0U8_9ACTN|nr:aminoglycoside phosphotransferase family protein [Streptomyces sp. V2]PWG10182.1 kinase [Streptomyces sp. V2]